MMGRNNSVASRLIADFPNISIIKCICHSVAIVASEACKKLPRTPEHLASGIYSFLSRSSKRQCEFIECQMQSETEILKMLHPSQTRWLSLAVVVERIVQQWEPLKIFFTKHWVELHTKGSELIYAAFNEPTTKLYFLFLKFLTSPDLGLRIDLAQSQRCRDTSNGP
ncbi:hypothetical protein HCN44_009907 [Aphidius gifuensis]|uniref:DUF659 domain-containing protein n=1 Tax=Aphidius gifuensis TaxID=684658 RepID=A0A834Y031_APHGI|nr:hypothetical protein HCN44_007747 [Aphidius gifuensis]KAF7996071.1 hypothetical protein HCN44_009907 [Aphidius gifuensis]